MAKKKEKRKARPKKDQELGSARGTKVGAGGGGETQSYNPGEKGLGGWFGKTPGKKPEPDPKTGRPANQGP